MLFLYQKGEDKKLQERIREYLGNYKKRLSGPEKKLMELINGAEPKNESERKLKADIEKIKEEGGIIDIPSM